MKILKYLHLNTHLLSCTSSLHVWQIAENWTSIKSHRLLNCRLTSHFSPACRNMTRTANQHADCWAISGQRQWSMIWTVFDFLNTLSWPSTGPRSPWHCDTAFVSAFVLLCCMSFDRQGTGIASLHVSWYVCQIHMGGLWSSCRVKLASEEESLRREKQAEREENKD